MLSIYVGKYTTIKESKKDENKLRLLGVYPYLFQKGSVYTLKVFSCSDEAGLNLIKQKLICKGFDAYVGE